MGMTSSFFPKLPGTLEQQKWLRSLLVILLILGIFFHFFNLDRKIVWHDETYTAMRAAGYTVEEVSLKIFQNRIVSVPDLQQYQTIKPNSTFQDTLTSLALEDPQHPPFYFLIARFWMQAFGSSLVASRMLPVLISLISLPFIYFLALELFASKLTAILATVFLSLSPCDILFAQTARQYSLLTLTAIASSLFLLKALKKSHWKNWSLYTLTSSLGFYTHPFFALTLLGQIVFVFCTYLFSDKNKTKIFAYLLAVTCTFILYFPWILVLIQNYQRARATTDWTGVAVEISYLIKLWILSFTSLFIDLNFGFGHPLTKLFGDLESPVTFLTRLPFLIFIFIAIYAVIRQGVGGNLADRNRSTWIFIITSIFIPFLLLALPDLIQGGKRSAVTRYLLPCFPGVQLAVAYYTTQLLLKSKQWWRVIFAIAMTITIVSCVSNAFVETSWSKDLSYANGEVASLIEQKKSPLVASDRGDNWTNFGDILALSYILDKDVNFFLSTYPTELNKIAPTLEKYNKEIFAFRPSKSLLNALNKLKIQGQFIIENEDLWKGKTTSDRS
jgi:uncharacterized membrane protein